MTKNIFGTVFGAGRPLPRSIHAYTDDVEAVVYNMKEEDIPMMLRLSITI